MRLATSTSPEVGSLDPDGVVLVLPIGSVEQHSYHLPIGTDTLVVDAIAHRVEEQRPATVVLSPPLWFGASAHHLGFPGSTSIGGELLHKVVVEVLAAYHESTKISRFLVLNGHGGNDPGMKVAMELLRRRLPNVRGTAANYWAAMFDGMKAAGVEVPPDGLGHACDVETSLVLAVAPELVKMDRLVPDPRRAEESPWLARGWDFKETTDHGGVGDPTGASAEWGEQMVGHAVARLARLCDQLLEER
ncbi:MAG: creatinine amidohydrolase [Acidimicrobiaceae bacterium]|nr:creatinine amidohydrolase [Acidimicrobiaceae bacterium]MDQ1444031.1 creatinine amidohydrolase [Acidimicrobiaceae bacterium]